ncbi:hypothetical protein [Paraburkholderia sp. BR14374]
MALDLPARQSSAAQAGQQWHPDEMFVKLRGKRYLLRRARR